MTRLPICTKYLLLASFLVVVALSRPRRESLGNLDHFPNPTNDFEQCGRKQKSFVCDPELYIRPKHSDYLDKLLLNATNSDLVWCPLSSTSSTSDSNGDNTNDGNKEQKRERYGTINGIDRSDFELRGLQIGVALISSFKNYDHQVPVTASYNDYDFLSKKYAKSIHDQWGIGDADCNNGIMIFIAVEDRVMYISTGRGIKNIVTDQFIDYYLMSKIRPYMRQERYDEAIIEMLDKIFELLFYQDDQESSNVWKEWGRMSKKASNGDGVLFSFFGLYDVEFEDCLITSIVLGFIGYVYLQSKRNAEYRECQERLAAIYAQSQQNRFNQQSCPICLDDFANDSDGARPTSLLACGHKFCTGCLDEWFGNRVRSQHVCPVCRQHRDNLSHVPQNVPSDANNNADDPNNSNNANNANNADNAENANNDSSASDAAENGNNSNGTSNSRNSGESDGSRADANNPDAPGAREGPAADAADEKKDDRDDRNDYRRDRSDFSDEFPSVDKTQNNGSNGSGSTSTFYGARAGAQGGEGAQGQGRDYEQERQDERQRREENVWFRRYAAMNVANDMMYRHDLNFRLRRMRHFYPRYIDDSMVNRWSSRGYSGGNFAQDAGFRANNPTPPRNPSSGASRRSSWGSGGGGGRSFSFGGGSSFGGGGGGGRW